MSMFCYQCSEAANNTGCTIQGVCGKSADVSNLQDMLIWVLKGISYYAQKARELGASNENVDFFVIQSLFTTITNANFDQERMTMFIDSAFQARKTIKELFEKKYFEKYGKEFTENVPQAASWYKAGGTPIYELKGSEVGVLMDKNEDIRSLKYFLIFGLKGIAAYAEHAYVLDKSDSGIFAFVEKGLAATLREDITVDELLGLIMEAGKISVDTMALLDGANTGTYGKQEVTKVFTGTYAAPSILVSGHDLRDLHELLEQTKDKGIKIYTHGEMLACNAYPELKKYPHLAGNFGTAWYNQQKEFEEFGGVILMTTNCLVKPRDSYAGKLFTTGVVAYPGIEHIQDRKPAGQKDFSRVIAKALETGPIKARDGKYITIGFGHDQIAAVADKVVDAVKTGKIKKFFVMGGCDGRNPSRKYYTQFAQELPKDTVILTAGCAKYRYNMLDLGDIDGIPRVLDAGQCNDSYSLAVTALKLKEVFGVADINDLPIEYNIAWYEQKAVAVLLALLYLGVKNIKLGPVLPAFLSPAVAKVVVEKFNISLINDVQSDMEQMLK